MAFFRTLDGKGYMHINFGRNKAPQPCLEEMLPGDDAGRFGGKCYRPSEALCDAPAGVDLADKPVTCDKPLCAKHRNRGQIAGTDYCSRHKHLAGLVVLLLIAAPAAAQDRPLARSIEKAALTTFLAGCAADVGTTLYAVQSGAAREGNPALAPFAQTPAAFAVTVGAGCTGAAVLTHTLGKDHPKAAAVTAVVLAAARVTVVVHNLRLAR